MDYYVGFQSVNFGVNSDISYGEDGLHLGECVFRQSYSFLYFCVASGIWGYYEAKVFKGAYLFYSFPFAKSVTYRNLWLFWDDHALSLLCIQLKSFVLTFDCDCCKDVFAVFLASQQLALGNFEDIRKNWHISSYLCGYALSKISYLTQYLIKWSV